MRNALAGAAAIPKPAFVLEPEVVDTSLEMVVEGAANQRWT